jgi:hypothetical protein
MAQNDTPKAPPGAAEYEVPYSSNSIRLSGRQWLAVAAFAALVVMLAPVAWKKVEKFTPTPDYRLPYGQGGDYWFYERWCAEAVRTCDVLLVGDSFVWGQYVKPDETLSDDLNTLAGKERFANLGLDGLHPVAMAGLLEYHARAIRGKTVILHLNPLWMSSPRHDLREEEESRFNHPELVPQFFPRVPSYHEAASRRIGISVERYLPFVAWTRHLQMTWFDGMDIPAWTADHPYESPVSEVMSTRPVRELTFGQEPISWTRRGMLKQDLPWVSLDDSLQWRFFRRSIDILKARNNRVFVLLGPFNSHMLEPASLARYSALKLGMERWLSSSGVHFYSPPLLPSSLYADASHPLAPGYLSIARALYRHLPLK